MHQGTDTVFVSTCDEPEGVELSVKVTVTEPVAQISSEVGLDGRVPPQPAPAAA